MSEYIYQRSGDALVKWSKRRASAPRSSSVAPDRDLGSLGGDETTLGIPLPAPGAPEPLGCACDKTTLGETTPNSIGAQVPLVPIAVAAAAYFLFFRKKRKKK